MVRLGITGSRCDITANAITAFDQFLQTIDVNEVHHGDCIGADSIIHNMILINSNCKNTTIIIHPPKNSTYRANCNGNNVLIHSPKDYLVRNKDIVNDTDALIAFPSTKNEVLRSGTWSTIRYARKCSKPIIVIYPDGSWIN